MHENKYQDSPADRLYAANAQILTRAAIAAACLVSVCEWGGG